MMLELNADGIWFKAFVALCLPFGDAECDAFVEAVDRFVSKHGCFFPA